MKILTKEEEEAHYYATVKGGSIGGVIGTVAGLAGVAAGSLRFPIIRHLTLPMKAFLVTSTGTFAAITTADSASRNYEKARHPEDQYQDTAAKSLAERRSKQSTTEAAIEWAREHRYHIVGGSWVASMGIALGLVSRSPMSTAQKLVQARVYAQGLTVAVLVATAAFEISDQRNDKGRYETVETYDPKDPKHKKLVQKKIEAPHKEEYEGEDQWKDMIKAEEQRLKQRDAELKEYEVQHHKEGHVHNSHKKGDKAKKHDEEYQKSKAQKDDKKSEDKKGKDS